MFQVLHKQRIYDFNYVGLCSFFFIYFGFTHLICKYAVSILFFTNSGVQIKKQSIGHYKICQKKYSRLNQNQIKIEVLAIINKKWIFLINAFLIIIFQLKKYTLSFEFNLSYSRAKTSFIISVDCIRIWSRKWYITIYT